MPLEYRPATPDDVPECVEIRGTTRENAVSVQRLARMGITVESWAEEVRSRAMLGFLCADEELVAGYCFGERAAGEIVVLALRPAYEARGIGRHLLSLLVRRLHDLGHARLVLGCSPDSAKRSFGLYRHLGWTSTGTFDQRGDEILEFFPQSDANGPDYAHDGYTEQP